MLQLSDPGFTSLGIMSRDSGSAEESLEVVGHGQKRRVVNLDEVVDYGDGEVHRRHPNWTPVTSRRGIEQICTHFLDAVRAGQVLSATDVLATHAPCEEIACTAESLGSAT